MPEKEKEIVKKIKAALPNMDELNKGYLLGYAEAMAACARERPEEEADKSN